MRNLTVALVAAIVLMGGFYGGFKVGQNRAEASVSASPTPAGLGAAAGAGGRAGAGAGGAGALGGAGGAGAAGGAAGGASRGGVQGTITSVGTGTINVHTSTGDVTVSVGPNTTITRAVSGTAFDLQKNVTVTVQGQKGADGSIQATGITILPAGATTSP